MILVSSNLHSETTHVGELRKGIFQTSATITELISELSTQEQKSYESIIAADELIEWEIYVPTNYQPNKKPGLMVYISPSRTGKIPERWISLMDKHNLIWVSANRSGNNIDPRKRLIMAVLATTFIYKKYPVDLNRVYVSGLSGGGRMASIVASQFPHLFKGAIYNCGVNFWKNISVEKIDAIKQNRFVFVTGRNDFNLEDTNPNISYNRYITALFPNISYV